MAALFGGTSARPGKKSLVEFKAGKMYLKGKMCHPDKRKGLIYVHQSDDSLMHFCWKDRSTGKVEDDLIIFPEDVEFKHVPQCTTGRVYVLKFKSSTRKIIFWIQESSSDQDEENCKKVNDMLNNPPSPNTNRGSAASSAAANAAALAGIQASDLAGLATDSDLQNLLGNMSQQQLIQLIGGMGGMGSSGSSAGLSSALRNVARPGSTQSTDSATPLRVQSSPGPRAASEDTSATPQPRPVTAAVLPSQLPAEQGTEGTGTSGTPAAIQLSDLQNILSNINVPTAEEKEPLNLADALKSDTMIPILADPAVQERLTPFLPQDSSIPSSAEELRNTVTSPQFRQALAGFSSALASGQMGPVIAQFGLSAAAVEAANKGDVEAFVKAMQAEEKNASSSEEKMEEN